MPHSLVFSQTRWSKAVRVVSTSILFLSLATSFAHASFQQQAKFTPGAGKSVALSADGNTLIDGGYNEDGTFVFTRSGTAWTQQGGKLVGSGEVGTAHQGTSVAVSSDGNTFIVGGNGDNNDTGAAWVFTRSGGVWTQQGAKLVGTGGGGSPQGSSVALSGDGNTAIVGGEGPLGATGGAWVFTRSGGVWSQQGPMLLGTGAVGGALQGSGVALSADGNTAVVGGQGDNNNQGAAWVFTRSGGLWSQQGGKLVGTGVAGFAGQGSSVSLSADGNTAVVGGQYDNGVIGAVWVFTRSGSVWSQQGGKLVGGGQAYPGDPGDGRNQGAAVAISADASTMVEGAYDGANYNGATWVFRRSGGVWSQQAKLIGVGFPQGAQGMGVAVSANGRTIAVGAPLQDNFAGAAYVWVDGATADLVAGGVPGMYAPSVPFKSGVGSSSSAPTVLDGNAFNTVFAYSYTNAGASTASGFTTNEYIDGALILSWMPPAIAAGAGTQWNSSLRTVRGGLHTMGFQNDVTNVLDEFVEGNNNHASQWVWSPLPMTLGVPVTRPGLPDPQGGWSDIPAGAPRYPNIDGLRSPLFQKSGTYDDMWGAVALTSTDVATNPDLQVFSPLSSGPADGFRSPSKTSARPGDATDLVVVDVDSAPRTLDVGLYKSAGSAPVKVQAVSSIPLLGLNASNTYGPYSLGPDNLVALFGFPFATTFDNMTIRLLNLSGGANLDFMMFGRTDPTRLYNPGEAVATAAANGDGAGEYYHGSIPAYAALAVIKAGSADVAKTAMFDLVVSSSNLGVDDGLPTHIALGPITPNPAHGAAAMWFDLPHEMPVDLAAFDLGGRRVSTLANGAWTAGRHALRWSTLGVGGQPLPSGMYIVRFSAGGYSASQRVLVIR